MRWLGVAPVLCGVTVLGHTPHPPVHYLECLLRQLQRVVETKQYRKKIALTSVYQMLLYNVRGVFLIVVEN